MNEIEIAKLNEASFHFKNVRLSVLDFAFVLGNYKLFNFDRCTTLDLLKHGFWGTINNCRIYVHNGTSEGNANISDYDGPIIRYDKIDWSPQIKIIYLDERYTNLKAFW